MGKGPQTQHEYDVMKIVSASQVVQNMNRVQGITKEVSNEDPRLKGRVVYYRVPDPDSVLGKNHVKYLEDVLQYRRCKNGEQFVDCPGGVLWWCPKEQIAQNKIAMRQMGDQIMADIGKNAKMQIGEGMGHALGASEVHAETSTKSITVDEFNAKIQA